MIPSQPAPSNSTNQRLASSGDAVGKNADSGVAKGASRTYTYYVPNDKTLEGAHYLHPGPGFRALVNHGLFGSVVVEPPGSTYLDPNFVDEAHSAAAQPAGMQSGWEATIRPAGAASFRENVQLYHEIGNEDEKDAVFFNLGPHPPRLWPEDIELAHHLWLELSAQGPGAKLHHRDIIGVALRRMNAELRSPRAREVIDDIHREVSHANDSPALPPAP